MYALNKKEGQFTGTTITIMANSKWKKRLKRWFKLRFAVLYPFGMWAIVAGHPTDASIMRAIWFILIGLAIRSWANCYAIKTEKLTTSGPYAYVRHPLYLGSLLILIGFLIMLKVHWIIAGMCVLVVIAAGYTTTVQKEEQMLLEKFGQEYSAYCKAVPAFYPTLFAFKGGQKWGPSFERYFRSQEYKLFIWMIIIVIGLHLKEEFIVEQESVDIKTGLLIIMAALLGLADLIGEFFRKREQ